MTDLFTALALVLVIEGLFLAAFPNKIRELLVAIDQLPREALRMAGLVAAGLGVFLVWLIRG
jgi:uncharacterized protein YjeT (DUF2065 family)